MENTVNFDEMFQDSSQAPAPPKEVKQEEVKQEVVATAPVQSAPAQQAPVQQAPVQVAQQAPVAKSQAVSDDFEIGFSDDMEKSLGNVGIGIGDIGVKVSKVPIERYKASVSKVDRISFLTKKVIPIKYHFFDGAGSILCFHGKCCDIGGVPQVRYLFPIAVYQTDAEGNISGKKVEIKILSAGEDLYKSIITINNGIKQYGGIDHGDMLVTCTDEKYQKIALTFAGKAVWRQYVKIAEFLKERWMQDGDKAYMAVARQVDAPTFDKLMHLDEEGEAVSGFATASSADLSQFFNDND